MRTLRQRIWSFAVSGLWGFALGAVINTVLADVIGIRVDIANAIRMVITSGVKFHHNRQSTWSDRRDRSMPMHVLRYLPVKLASLALQQAAFTVMLHRTSLDHRVILFICIVGIGPLKFLANHFFVYAQKRTTAKAGSTQPYSSPLSASAD